MNKLAISLVLPTLLTSTIYAAELGLNFGAHDTMVSNINDEPFNGSGSHTFGANVGAFVHHKTAEGIVLKGDVVIYLDRDKDHLDPDHIPVWWIIHLDGDGPIYNFNTSWGLRWLLQLANKQNTVSGIEREQKQNYGIGLDYNTAAAHFAANIYGGFFYRELDDDAPSKYGYDRRDLGYGSSVYSIQLEGSYTFAKTVTLGGHVQSWKSLGVGAAVVESEAVLNIIYHADALIKQSSFNLDITYTNYNMDVYYRKDLGVPALPWDNDTLMRAYMSIPWSL